MRETSEEEPLLFRKETLFMIYGASVGRGYYTKYRLEEVGCSVLALIDRNAPNIPPLDETPIYTVDQAKACGTEVGEIVVIVTVSNRFMHKEIQQELSAQGFRYVLYQLEQIETRKQKEFDLLFDGMLNPTCLISSLFSKKIHPCSQIQGDDRPKDPVLSYGAESVTTFVPVTLLFGPTVSLSYAMTTGENKQQRLLSEDYPLCFYNMFLSLYDSYSKGKQLTEEEWTRFFTLYVGQRESSIQTSESLQVHKKSLRERYSIYVQMEKKLCIDPLFFQRNPLDVIWNERGYFNIQDGNNRACFLLSKGHYVLPCRMSLKDYDQWNRTPHLSPSLDVLQNTPPTFPLSHPHFVQQYPRHTSFHYQKLFAFYQWLWKHEYNPRQNRCLGIGYESWFYIESLSKLGNPSLIVEEEDTGLALLQHICKVSHSKDIECVAERDTQKKYEIVIMNEYQNTLSWEELAHQTTKLLLLDVEEENTAPLDCRGFSGYELLGIFAKEEKFYRTYLLIK